MTTLDGCPEPILLSQLLDRALMEEEEQALHHHIETCNVCNARLTRLTQAKETAQAELRRIRPPILSNSPTSACLSPERVAAYVHRLLPVEEHNVAERHLHACSTCLGEVMEVFRVATCMSAVNRVPVSTALQARVSSQWQSTPTVAAQATATLSRLVVQAVHKGLELVEQHLVTPLREVQTMFAPQPAFRSEETSPPLCLTIHATQATIEITAVPEGAGSSLSMTIVGLDRFALAGQRVFLRQGGSTIFSARTDRNGVIHMPHLEPNVYEFSCIGIQTSFQLELRT